MSERRPGGAIIAPNRKTIALVAVAFALLLGAYLLGRATPPQFERAVPAELTAPASPSPTIDVPSAPSGIVADLEGLGEPLSELVFDDTRKVVLQCNGSAAPSKGQIVVSYLDTTIGPPRLLANEAMPQTVRCGDCAIDMVDLQGEGVVMGECPTVVVRGAFEAPMATNMSFVLATPPNEVGSVVALVVDCGVTSLAPADGGLVLQGQAPTPDASASAVLYPQVFFERSDNKFRADDLPLLRHFCDAGGSEQLSGLFKSGDRWYARQSPLAYLTRDSNLDTIGTRRQVLIALTGEQCGTLHQAQRDALDSPDQPTLAEIVGLEPPDTDRDWYLTCQIVGE